LRQAKSQRESTQRQKRIAELEAAPATEARDRELARLRPNQKRAQSLRQERQKKVDAISQELAELEEKAQTVAKTESRLERLIEEQMVRMEPHKKRLMDNLRVIARNAFYQRLAPFKKAYNNYRDDHDQFRRLTLASGVLEVSADQIVVHLLPGVSYSPQLRRIIRGVLEGINDEQPVLPDGSGRRLHFRLAARTELKLTIDPGE
jgi:hypothetical protein